MCNIRLQCNFHIIFPLIEGQLHLKNTLRDRRLTDSQFQKQIKKEGKFSIKKGFRHYFIYALSKIHKKLHDSTLFLATIKCYLLQAKLQTRDLSPDLIGIHNTFYFFNYTMFALFYINAI